VVLAGLSGVTLSQSRQGNQATITIIASNESAGVAIGAGTQTATSGTVIFSNSNGVTFGLTGQTLTASAAGGGVAVGAGTQTATSGTVVFSNSNGITFGLNASTLTATVSREPSIAAGAATASSGTVIFSNSNNVTFGLNGQTLTGSASFAQTTQPAVNLAAGTQTATSGTVVFSNSNGVSFGMSNSSIVTASHDAVNNVGAQDFGGGAGLNVGVPRWVWASSAGFNVAFSKSVNGASGSIIAHAQAAAIADSAGTQTSGTVIFSNSNNVSFGLNAGTLTASFSATNAGNTVTISGWENYGAADLNATTMGDIQHWVQRVHFPHNLLATEANLVAQVSNSTNAGGTITIRMGIYTMSGSTASLASSASRTIGYNSTAAASSYTALSGYRYRSVGLGTWSITPGDYMIGVVVSIATSGTSGSYSWKARRNLPLEAAEFGTAGTDNFFWNGSYLTVTGQLRNSFRPQDVGIQGGAGAADENDQPWLMLLGTF